MLNKNIQILFDKGKVKYDVIHCTPHLTTPALAKETHVSLKGLAKTVLVKVDDKIVLLVEPRDIRTDFEKWKKAIGCEKIEYALESDIDDILNEIDRNSVPAFDLFEINDVYVDDMLAHSGQIAFPAGNTSEIIRMNYADYVKWVKPKLFHLH